MGCLSYRAVTPVGTLEELILAIQPNSLYKRAKVVLSFSTMLYVIQPDLSLVADNVRDHNDLSSTFLLDCFRHNTSTVSLDCLTL